MGWRYLLFALGGLTLILWGIRFFAFHLHESPRYLVGLGKDAEAVDIIHRMAEYNGKTTSLSVDDLRAAAASADLPENSTAPKLHIVSESAWYKLGHIRALFATPKIAFSTSMLIAVWGWCSEHVISVSADRAQVSSDLHQHCIINFCRSCE
jgi:hypothetical protein